MIMLSSLTILPLLEPSLLAAINTCLSHGSFTVMHIQLHDLIN